MTKPAWLRARIIQERRATLTVPEGTTPADERGYAAGVAEADPRRGSLESVNTSPACRTCLL